MPKRIVTVMDIHGNEQSFKSTCSRALIAAGFRFIEKRRTGFGYMFLWVDPVVGDTINTDTAYRRLRERPRAIKGVQ
jgi:hypothetical protein